MLKEINIGGKDITEKDTQPVQRERDNQENHPGNGI